jgi:hypothetical protein
MFGRFLHKHILPTLLTIPIYIVDSLLQYSPALCHWQVDLILIRAHVSAVRTEYHVMIVVLLVFTRHEHELDLVDTREQWLHNPSRNLARVILYLFG